MKIINVIDLDKTLIPYDSFGKIIKNEIKNFRLKVIYLTILRVLRLISLEIYKGKITHWLERYHNKAFFERFAQNIHDDIDSEVLKEVNKESNSQTINILLSASPDIYVKYLIIEMDWVGSGSYFENKKFIHLHGKGKINWLIKNFPKDKFKYQLAISDSATDDDLLKMFKKEIKWILP